MGTTSSNEKKERNFSSNLWSWINMAPRFGIFKPSLPSKPSDVAQQDDSLGMVATEINDETLRAGRKRIGRPSLVGLFHEVSVL